MGTKDKRLQRKLAREKQEQRQREAQARAARANLRGLAADLNELQEIQTVALTPETMAELEARGISREVLEQMRQAGMHWNPVRASFEGAWEAA
jgi:FKBP-type peptidyl-prolyl cis-trans isomerase (trigger factor)